MSRITTCSSDEIWLFREDEDGQIAGLGDSPIKRVLYRLPLSI